MKYEVGDKILLLQTDEEGIVVDIMNEKMLMIKVGDVTFPVFTDQVDFPYFKMFTQKKTPDKTRLNIDDVRKEKDEQAKEGKKVKDGVYLNFIPVYDKDIFDDDIVEKMKLYLVNQNEEAYRFSYQLYYTGKSEFQLKNSIDPLSEFYLHDVLFEDMNDSPRFGFEFSLAVENKKKAPFFEVSLKPKAKQLFKKIEELQLKSEPSFAYELFINYPDREEPEPVDLTKLGNAGYKIYDAKHIRQNLPPALDVIDLHIDKLISDFKGLSNFEILQLQLKEFEKYFELSIAHIKPTLTVIHGVGEGVLKNEIHSILKTKDNVASFSDDYHPLYGNGATLIKFK